MGPGGPWGALAGVGGLCFGPPGSCFTGPSASAFSSWTTAEFLWLQQGGAAVHAVYSDPFWQYSEGCFFSLPHTLRAHPGGSWTPVSTHGSRRGVSEQRINPLPRALCHVPPAPPPAAHPRERACFCEHRRRKTRGAECVSFTVTHFFSLCILADPRLKIPSNCSQVGFQSVLHL